MGHYKTNAQHITPKYICMARFCATVYLKNNELTVLAVEVCL